MTAAPRPRLTLDEYLEIETMSEVRHEYVAGEVYAMAGGTVAHSALASSLLGFLHTHLRGGPCRAHGSDLRIWIDRAEVGTYADVTVLCDPVRVHPTSPTHVTNPKVIVEVLSQSSERYDREQKRIYYQSLETLREYVLVAQDRRHVEIFESAGDLWQHHSYVAGQTFSFPSIGFAHGVNELYEDAGVEVPPHP